MLLEIIQGFTILLFSVMCHEVAHGWVALRLGDPTAKLAGRLTFNPLKHIDPVGTILVPVVLKLLPINFVFGWAKPVPINFLQLRNPKRDMIWVALAGPLTNFSIAVLLSAAFLLDLPNSMKILLTYGVVINLMLGIFNLIPIPPLDGSRVIMGVLPYRLARVYSRLEPFGFVILIILLNLNLLDFLAVAVEYMAFHLGVPLRLM